MTLREALKRGIERVRDPKWANPRDYIKILIIEKDGVNYHGPWVNLFSPVNKLIGQPNPQPILCTTLDWNDDGVEEYTGPIDEDEGA